MDTEKIIEAKKFLAELVENVKSDENKKKIGNISEEIYQILGKFTPDWIINSNPKNEDWVISNRATHLERDEEKFEFTSILDSSAIKKEEFVNGILTKSIVEKIVFEVFTPVVFPSIIGITMKEDEW